MDITPWEMEKQHKTFCVETKIEGCIDLLFVDNLNLQKLPLSETFKLNNFCVVLLKITSKFIYLAW